MGQQSAPVPRFNPPVAPLWPDREPYKLRGIGERDPIPYSLIRVPSRASALVRQVLVRAG